MEKTIYAIKKDAQALEELIAISEILTDHPGMKPKWAKRGLILYGDDFKTFKKFDDQIWKSSFFGPLWRLHDIDNWKWWTD